jgi:NAD(P)-dependent dehydrogenase (short-subunit alcohol dehydrogenase family)
MQGTLTNQAVVVFGGSSGIGLATARLVSQHLQRMQTLAVRPSINAKKTQSPRTASSGKVLTAIPPS